MLDLVDSIHHELYVDLMRTCFSNEKSSVVAWFFALISIGSLYFRSLQDDVKTDDSITNPCIAGFTNKKDNLMGLSGNATSIVSIPSYYFRANNNSATSKESNQLLRK